MLNPGDCVLVKLDNEKQHQISSKEAVPLLGLMWWTWLKGYSVARKESDGLPVVKKKKKKVQN